MKKSVKALNCNSNVIIRLSKDGIAMPLTQRTILTMFKIVSEAC